MSDLFSRRAFLSRSGQATAVAAGAMTSPGRAAGQAAEKKKIRIAQLGVGHAHAAGKMQAYRHSGAFEVVGETNSGSHAWRVVSGGSEFTRNCRRTRRLQ